MIYAALDTNVLVSALLSKSSESTINKLMKAVIECKLTPMYSTEIIAEYVEVLSRCLLFSWILSLRILSRIMRSVSDDQHIYIDHYFQRDSIWILKILTENPAENDLTMFSFRVASLKIYWES